MNLPEPFNAELDVFLAGSAERELDIDPIFAKTFDRIIAEFQASAPEDIIPEGGGTRSIFAPELHFIEVPAGIILVGPRGEPIGGYLSCDLSLAEEWQGRGLGAEIIIERCLRDGEVPTWNLDKPAYSPAGLGAHRAAWRHVRSHREETAERVKRLAALGYNS